MARCGVLVQLVLIIVMVTCVARAQVERTGATAPAATTSPATTTTSPTTVPEEIVENPFYLAWVKYKPGTTVEFELKTDAVGQQMTTHITQRLVEVSPEKVACRRLPGRR